MASHLQKYLNLSLANSAADKITLLKDAANEVSDAELKKNLETALFSLNKLHSYAKASTHEYLNAVEEYKDIKNTFEDLSNALKNIFKNRILITALSKDNIVKLINWITKIESVINTIFVDNELGPFLKKMIAACAAEVAEKNPKEKKEAFDRLNQQIQDIRSDLTKYGSREGLFNHRFLSAIIEAKLHLKAINLEIAVLDRQQTKALPQTTDAPVTADEPAKRKIMIAAMVDAYISKRKKIYHDAEFKIIAQTDPTSKEILRKFNALCQELLLLSDRNDTLTSMQDKHDYLKKTYPHANLNHFLDEMVQKSFALNDENTLREKNASILFEKIDLLKKHGEKMMANLHPRDQAYGLYTRDFANSLSEKAHGFFDFKKRATPAEETHFKKEFTQLVKSEETFLATHRAEMQKILTDILKGLALVLSVAGAIIYYKCTKKNPFDFFFKHKTARQEHTDIINETFTQTFTK